MEITTNLTEAFEQAVKSSKTEQQVALRFTEYMFQLQQQTTESVQKELSDTKEMVKKLGEGVKKYKTALDNLKSVLSTTEE